MKSDNAKAAQQIRKQLKEHGIQGNVTSKSYSMGSSVTVRLTNPLPATKDAVKAFAGKYEYGHFDGMTDCYHMSNTNDDLPQVKFVFVEASYSDEIKAAVAAYVESKFQTFTDYDAQTKTWQVLSGAVDCDFWTAYKPHCRA